MDPAEIPLRDLHLPTLIGWWPLAPGWWVVIALVAAGLAWMLRNYLRTRARGAARRHALRQFETLTADYRQHQNAVLYGRQLSELLRRTMLAYAPRSEVAGLTGEAWLAWLDRGMHEPQFQGSAGRGLLELPYRDQSADIAAIDIAALQAAVRNRIQTPLGEQR